MENAIEENLELQALLNVKKTGFNYQQPRHEDWRENYQLYRDKVVINRLTQRQTVNIPLMKTTLRTLMKDIDDMPVIQFENLDNDKQAEIFQNEYWQETIRCNNGEIQDIVDKKQDFFFGRTFDSWQIENGKIVFDIEDPHDILVDSFVNPYDIDSSRFLVHQHIFVPLSSLKRNPDFDKDEVAKLEEFFISELGIIKAQDNQNSLQAKNQIKQDIGVNDTDDPVLSETYVELTYYNIYRSEGESWKDNRDGKTYTTDEEQIFVFVEAEEQTILMKKPQEKIIGPTQDHYWRNHYRYNSWGDDIDKQYFWTDGVADIVRPNNKVLNAWFSQLVENRTLRNFGMHYYDAGMKANGFEPGSFNPVPFGWYPLPLNGKNIGDVMQKVDIPDLSESIDEMQFAIDMTEKATGSVPAAQGINPPSGTPLGTTQIVASEAKARTKGMSKFYTDAWKKRAEKFLKLIEAAPEKLDAVKIYKEGKNTSDIYAREIKPSDWMTKSGYRVKIWSQDEKKANDTDSLNKINNAVLFMPDNPKLKEVQQRKLLEFADLKPEEISAIMEYEDQKNQMIANGQMLPMQPQLPQPQQQTQPRIQPTA